MSDFQRAINGDLTYRHMSRNELVKKLLAKQPKPSLLVRLYRALFTRSVEAEDWQAFGL